MIAPPAAPPSGRMYHGAVYDADGGRMVVFGGHPQYLNDVWALSLAGPASWTLLAPAGTPPSPRWGHAAVYDPVRKRMLVMGGFDGFSNLSDIHALTLTGAPTWSPIVATGGPPPGRRNHLLIYDPLRDRLIVFGGYTGAFTNDVWALNLSGSPPAWTNLTPAGTPPTGRSMVAGVYDPVGDRILIHAGWSGVSYLGDLWSLSLSGIPAWAPVAASGPAPGARRDHVAVYDAGTSRVVYFGGSNGSSLGDVWSLDLSGSPAWSPVVPPSAGPTARNSLTAVLDPPAHRMVVFGGYDGNYRNDAWGLSLAAGSEDWSEFVLPPPPPWPVQNCDYAAVYDESRDRVIHTGGKAGSYFGETWALNLGAMPDWDLLLPNNVSLGRHGHTAVLDLAQDRALVFGGYNGSYLNDVWSLDLAGTPAWSPIFPDGAPPSPRMYHTAVTDPVRQRMVVFGGHPSFLNDVYVLPFVGTPTWSLLVPAGTPPAPRWGHCAVYDPIRDRMLVFGGFDAQSVNRNDVWALEFAPSPKWVELTPIGTPPPGRRNAALVYDSARDRLVLFGGFGPDFLNDVWELSLGGTPRWTQLTPTGGPPRPRNQITAVYQSSMDRVVFFGGWDYEFLREVWILNFVEQPTAALVSLVHARVGEAGVELAWQIGEGSDPPLTIERSDDGAGWTAVADANPDATGLLAWTDGAAPPGRRLGYRLVFGGSDRGAIGGEVWVDTPSRSPLAIQGVRPNPADERAVVRLVLADRQRATLDVVDVAGRRVMSVDLSGRAPGAHEVPLDGMGTWPAGLYLVRLTSGRERATARLMVVR